ncbi:MAG: FKBP-type peptidyl-prolyl cis-trans isomerase [Bacteroidia bacterium]|nr:FKBP-type peptidyl-prolyl cis-trans isomerase [Bacteroidia bacterium]
MKNSLECHKSKSIKIFRNFRVYQIPVLFSSFLLLLPFFNIISGCGNKHHQLSKKEIEQYKEPLVQVNKYLTKKDEELIKGYVERRKWKMDVTERGIYYMIYEHGSGAKAEAGKIVTINFDIRLLDGTLCYSSDSIGPKSFKIAKSDVISGLDEGILLLREGDKARFIIPPFLAYGLLGDGDKVPMRSIVVYDVELIKITDSY